MPYLFHNDGFAFYGEAQRLVFRPRPACGQRLHSGDHFVCCLRPGHDGPHESEDGEQWEDE